MRCLQHDGLPEMSPPSLFQKPRNSSTQSSGQESHQYDPCTTLIIPISEGWLIVCGKLVKVMLNFLCYRISASKSSREHCSSRHHSLERLSIVGIVHFCMQLCLSLYKRLKAQTKFLKMHENRILTLNLEYE